MFLILKRALSWAITSLGNKFCLRKRSRLIEALDNRIYVKFLQLEISLFEEKPRKKKVKFVILLVGLFICLSQFSY